MSRERREAGITEGVQTVLAVKARRRGLRRKGVGGSSCEGEGKRGWIKEVGRRLAM